MLTKRHLAVLRAALLFFDEEMAPRGAEVSRPYFEEPLDEPLTMKDIQQLREVLRTCELRYACCGQDGLQIISSELFPTIEGAQLVAASHSGRIATVLLDPLA